jgi:hypothetical protein
MPAQEGSRRRSLLPPLDPCVRGGDSLPVVERRDD